MTIPKGIKVVAPKYHKDMDELVVRLGKEGATDAMLADSLDVSTEQMADWESKHKSFRDALARARTSSKAMHERSLMAAYSSKEGNPALIQSLLRANYDGYQNSTYQPVGKQGGNKGKEQAETIDFNAEIQKLLDTLKAAGDEDDDADPRGKMKVGNKK